jgi:hypothetical protein
MPSSGPRPTVMRTRSTRGTIATTRRCRSTSSWRTPGRRSRRSSG